MAQKIWPYILGCSTTLCLSITNTNGQEKFYYKSTGFCFAENGSSIGLHVTGVPT
jgi:hypothetical protein